MTEFTIRLRVRDFWISLVVGIYASLGAFVALSRQATIENSPEIDLTSTIMLYTRTLYRSFSGNRLRTFLFALVIGLLVYIALQLRRTNRERLGIFLFSLLFASAQLVAMIFKKWGGYYLMMEAMEELGVAEIQPIRLFLKWSAYLIICYFLVAVLLEFFHRIAVQSQVIVRDGEKMHWAIRMCLMALFILLAWLPYFFIFYPGTSNEDTVIMIMEYNEIPSYIQKMTSVQADDIFITNHHPVILTYIFSWFINIGLHFGDVRIGVALYALLQMAALSLTFSGALQYLHFSGVSMKRIIVLQIFFMFFPIFPLYAICMLKDTVYAAFCLMFVLMMHYVARTRGEAFSKKRFVAGFFAVGCMMALTKVYAIYILLLVTIVYLIKYRRYWLRILTATALPPILYKAVFCGLLLPALHIAPGGVQEALSVPFQQTARYVVTYGDEVTEEEKAAIDAILPYEKLAKKYNPELSDPVKKYYNQEATKKEQKAYFKVWWQMFRKHPEVYVESLIHNTYQYYDINKISSLVYYKFNDYLQLHDEEGQYESLYVVNDEETLELRYAVNQLVLFLEKVPVVNIFASIGLWPWLYLFAFLYNLCYKKHAQQALLVVPIITLAVCMVSPDNGNTRYVMPLLYVLPFLIPLELMPDDQGAICYRED